MNQPTVLRALLLSTVPLFCVSEDVVVTTKHGAVKGKRVYDGDSSYQDRFFGIPFAKPPVGPLRFKAPHPAEPWTGVRDATNFGHMCPQLLPLGPPMSEDCLFLNIFSPKPSTNDTLLPVMFWIHGGSYKFGTGATFNSSQLADKGVVVVTINYRLDSLGFLSTMDSASPGNYGLLDQILALKWVKENIERFHGNPDDITLFGESAGGASVSILRLSPLAKGLFHKAIMESGVSLCPWAVAVPTAAVKSPLQNARELATMVGCGEAALLGNAHMVDCLRANASVIKLLTASEAIGLPTDYPIFIPTVETEFGVIPDTPLNLVLRGMGGDIPILSGVNKDEYSVFAEFKPVSVYTSHEVDRQILKLSQDFFPRHVPEVVDRIRAQYLAPRNLSTPEQFRNVSIEFQTDFGFITPTVMEVRHSVEKSAPNTPHYLYEFIYRATHTTLPTWAGVMHTSELPFVFGQPFIHDFWFTLIWPYQWSQQDQQVSSRFIDMWTNFAKYGNPTPQPVDKVTWSPVAMENQAYLEIGSDLHVKTDLIAERVQFWASLWETFGGV